VSTHPHLANLVLPDIDFGSLAASLMPATDDLSHTPWREHKFPGGEQGPVVQVLNADGRFAAYGSDEGDPDYDHLDLIRRVNACFAGLPDSLVRNDFSGALIGVPAYRRREICGHQRAKIDTPTARDLAIREQAETAMAGIGGIELYMLIRGLVVDTNFNPTFAWSVYQADDGTYTVRSLNVGILAWGLSAEESRYLVTAGRRIFVQRREGDPI
jgi:hypothetical protein